MNVQSHLFVLAYLPVVLILWRVLGRWAGKTAAQVFLLCAGALFCGWGAPWALLVLAGEGAVTYLLGCRIARDRSQGGALVWTGAVLLLAVLAFFKYTGFVLSLTPLEGLFTPPGWLMPLGLSFVTFQQILWLRDCLDGDRGGRLSPGLRLLPHLFRHRHLRAHHPGGGAGPQLRRPAPFSWDDLAEGLYCFALGLAKKVLVAGVFANGANFGYANVGSLSPADTALTILCYTLQIYFDFSGYCDMASGMARMMGVELPVNFNSPYQALSIRDFWGRWHITLSDFFRRCVYIPWEATAGGPPSPAGTSCSFFCCPGCGTGRAGGFSSGVRSMARSR